MSLDICDHLESQAPDDSKGLEHLCVGTVEFHNKKLANFFEIVEPSLWSSVEKQGLSPSCRFVLMVRILRDVQLSPSDVVVWHFRRIVWQAFCWLANV